MLVGQAAVGEAMEFSERAFSTLVEHINHAALDPSGWADVLHGLAAATDCIAGGLTIEDPFAGTGNPIEYFGFDPGHVAKTWHHYLPMNPLFAIGSRLQTGVIVANGMVCPVETFIKTEFYDGWARPQGICCPITLVLHRSGSSYIPLTLVRPDGKGDAEPRHFKLLARVAPLLERAFAVTLRLGRLDTRDVALGAAISNLSAGLLLLDAKGRVVFANEIGENLLRQAGVIETKGGVSTLSGGAALRMAFAAAQGPNGTITELVVRREDQSPLLLTAVPVTRPDAFAAHAARVTCAIVIGDVRYDKTRTVRRIGHGPIPTERPDCPG